MVWCSGVGQERSADSDSSSQQQFRGERVCVCGYSNTVTLYEWLAMHSCVHPIRISCVRTVYDCLQYTFSAAYTVEGYCCILVCVSILYLYILSLTICFYTIHTAVLHIHNYVCTVCGNCMIRRCSDCNAFCVPVINDSTPFHFIVLFKFCNATVFSQQLFSSTGFLAPCASLRVLPVCLCSAVQEDGRQHTRGTPTVLAHLAPIPC